MHALIVVAHPEPQSFNAALAGAAADAWHAGGHTATVANLYADAFDACEAPRHYADRLDTARFDAQREQRHHWERGTLAPEIALHVDLLRQADALILQFPLWWFGAPAILKGWMDRVFVYGGLYSSRQRHDRGVLHGRRVLLSVTTGSSAAACAPDGREGDTRLLLWPIMYALRYVGFDVLEPHLIHDVRGGLTGDASRRQDARLSQVLADYRTQLRDWHAWPRVPFNRDEDFDDNSRLKPGTPAYSPFIRPAGATR
ncbi:NADPH quinone oxidoreductase [Burkholderia lata]|uniref:NAD(P)H-dependent oxidoreductase n=1 Tax=Burkholderia lata (strain ATCC 17760 / DSM 23089 / LMG 22485 / NCIMB 9086 / R18194 / 383) TaxID=482957 RepID=UPI00145361E6|nr:NAD(P)H-dependent oxidoreductase [Burkholderia lata]VWC29627.1 NADPH quinone oxidoreductase [Burkholderia lata]